MNAPPKSFRVTVAERNYTVRLHPDGSAVDVTTRVGTGWSEHDRTIWCRGRGRLTPGKTALTAINSARIQQAAAEARDPIAV